MATVCTVAAANLVSFVSFVNVERFCVKLNFCCWSSNYFLVFTLLILCCSFAGNLGNSIILANHCAWFVVDKKNSSSSSSDPSSGNTSTSVGATSKDKSGAKGAKGANSANSVVGLLSSETVRVDLDETQLRVGIKMIRNGM